MSVGYVHAYQQRPGGIGCDRCGGKASDHDYEWTPGPTPFDDGVPKPWPDAQIARWLHRGLIDESRFRKLLDVKGETP